MSLLPACSCALLLACGGGGGASTGGSTPALTALSLGGPASVIEGRAAKFIAEASWSDGTSSVVTPTWSVTPQHASVSASGILNCPSVDADQTVTVTATFSTGEVTRTAAADVVIVDARPAPFSAATLSGKVLFEDGTEALYYFGDDLSLSVDTPGASRATGTWSIDSTGTLILSLGGQGVVRMTLVAESSTELQAIREDGAGARSSPVLEKTVPLDASMIPGVYVQSGTGYVWEFFPDGSGKCSIFGGMAFGWVVHSGVLTAPFANGLSLWMYARPSTEARRSAYARLAVAFVEYLPSGGLYNYYGANELTRR